MPVAFHGKTSSPAARTGFGLAVTDHIDGVGNRSRGLQTGLAISESGFFPTAAAGAKLPFRGVSAPGGWNRSEISGLPLMTQLPDVGSKRLASIGCPFPSAADARL